MTVVRTAFTNFSRGQIDHDMMGRFDLPLYKSGVDLMENFFTNVKGNGIFRHGLEDMLGVAFEDCAFHEFKFRIDQNYLLVFYNLKIRFLTFDSGGNFGFVLNGGSPLEVTSPYTLAQSKELIFAQNSDVVVITHQSHTPQDLTRIAADDFTLGDHTFSDSSGSPLASSVKSISAIALNNPLEITTSANHNFRTGQGVAFDSIGGTTELNGTTHTIHVVDDTKFFLIGVDGTTGYTAYTSGGNADRLEDNPAGCLFHKGRLYFDNFFYRPTSFMGSEAGDFNNFELPSTVVDTSPLDLTLDEISQPIEWLFSGDNSLIVGASDGVVAVNGGGVNKAIAADTVEATTTSAPGSNSSTPIKKDGLVFYFGAISRNMYSFSYDLLTESFGSDDANLVAYDITKGGVGKIRHKKDKEDLIYGVRDGRLITLNFNKKENVIGWHSHPSSGTTKDIAVITDNDGNPKLFALMKYGSDFFIEMQAPDIEFSQRVSFFTDKDSKDVDDEAYARMVAEELRQCNYLDNSLRVDDLQEANTITYDSGAGTVTAGTAVFSDPADIGKRISYKTTTGYESGMFEIKSVTSTTVVVVDVLQTPTVNSFADWYLSFQIILNLTKYGTNTISAVADGGYLNDFAVAAGQIDLGVQVFSAVIGYKYKGITKSFPLGFQSGAENTQSTMKNIIGFDTRFVATAGGRVGSSLYNLEDVQELKQGDYNYLPPRPIDGTKSTSLVDTGEKDKYFYIVQDLPLPMKYTAVILKADYSKEV